MYLFTAAAFAADVTAKFVAAVAAVAAVAMVAVVAVAVAAVAAFVAVAVAVFLFDRRAPHKRSPPYQL